MLDKLATKVNQMGGRKIKTELKKGVNQKN